MKVSRLILCCALYWLLSAGSSAALAGEPVKNRHQVRIGWGDMLFETLVFHASPPHLYDPLTLPEDYSTVVKDDFGFTGHIFAGYLFRFNRAVSIGAQMDFEGIFWKETLRDRFRTAIGPATPVRNYNLVIMPEVRFTCFEGKWVQIHGGLAAGVLFAFDNNRGFKTAPSASLNLLGVQVGHGHWSGALDFGLMAALNNIHDIYLLGSRLVSVSLNYQW